MVRSTFVRALTGVLAGVASLSFSLDASGQAYPSKTISIVAGFPPGGSVDGVARVVADGLSKEFGQTVVVENKTGATGIVAANHVATSKPDGYTFLLVPGGHALYGATFKTLPFDPVAGFEWISLITTAPFFIAVAANSPFRSLNDVVEKAKASPGTIKFGSVGPGSPHHLGIELLAMATGTKFVHVAYRGEGPVVTALQQAEVDFSIFTPIQVVGAVQSGALRALAVTAGSRSLRLPDVPTVQEALKIKEYNVGSWFALAGPAGVPSEIVAQVNAAVHKTLKTDEALTRLKPIGADVTPSSPKELRDRVANELAMWTRTVDAAGLQKQ
jgi:tripartite-type tricarboxylate transporter receptor subunit TctC